MGQHSKIPKLRSAQKNLGHTVNPTPLDKRRKEILNQENHLFLFPTNSKLKVILIGSRWTQGTYRNRQKPGQMTPRGTHMSVCVCVCACVCVCVCMYLFSKESRLLHHFTPDELPAWSSRVTRKALCCGSMLKLRKELTTVQVMTWALTIDEDWYPQAQL